MTNNIKGIFFDLGNTLRILYEDSGVSSAAKENMARLAGTEIDPQRFHQMVEERYEAGYRKWAMENMREAGDTALWCEWLLPDFDRELIKRNAQDLTLCYRQAKGVRKVVPHGEEVIQELQRRGYRLGIISNLIGEVEIPRWLKEDGFDRYFESVTLSSVCGIRKPDPEIYRLAEQALGIPLRKCASVADNLSRDITGAASAGIGCSVLFISPEKLSKKTITDENRPDYIIHDFMQLLDLFPAPEGQA